LSTVGDNNLLVGLARLRTERFNLFDHIHALNHLSEDHVLAIQPLGLGSAQEELGTVGVGSSVSHGQDSGSGVLQLEVLILELVTIDRLASSTVSGSEVTSLTHEVGDHSVEAGALESESFLTSAQSTEVLAGLWDHVRSQLHDNLAKRSAISGDFEENTRQTHCVVGGEID